MSVKTIFLIREEEKPYLRKEKRRHDFMKATLLRSVGDKIKSIFPRIKIKC